MEVKFRTESYSGTGQRDAAAIMAYETYCLGNTDIPDYLSRGILKGTPAAAALTALICTLETDGEGMDDEPTDAQIALFREVLAEVERATGYRIRFALWLADKKAMEEIYGKDMEDAYAYDAYPNRSGRAVRHWF